jgi:hypothetical protein
LQHGFNASPPESNLETAHAREQRDRFQHPKNLTASNSRARPAASM